MQDQLLHALIVSKNQAADDVLVAALRLGDAQEKRPVLDALLQRQTVHGLCGVIEEYDALPEMLQAQVLAEIKLFHPALREAGRSENVKLRLAALKLIALGRQGKLAYILSENLHDSKEQLSKAATEAMVALARWIASETRKLNKGVYRLETDDETARGAGKNSGAAATEPMQLDEAERDALLGKDSKLKELLPEVEPAATPGTSGVEVYAELMAQRPEIEVAVARALDVHRGRHGQDLLRAALLLADWPGSKTLAILHTPKHGGQSPMVRRLQQPPASEHVAAFLLGASHGQLRTHFASAFSHINEAPVLDALLRKTHWLHDHHLELCLHTVSRGMWWTPGDLIRDVDRRAPEDAAQVGEWIARSGAHDVVQDERMTKLLSHCAQSFNGRLRLLRIVSRRKRGGSVQLLRALLLDGDERIMRMAAREIIRRRPADYENMLLQLMTNAPESVRRVVSRAIGQVGFDQFWLRFDKLDRPTRKQAGRAMMKILPDAVQRLRRRLAAGAPDQRIKAMQMVQELGLANDMRDTIVSMCSDGNPRLRSKAVSVLGEIEQVPAEVVIERLVTDTDARVRANAIEVMESRPQSRLLPVLAQRALATNNRERANAIKALHRMRVGTAAVQLIQMMRDARPEHRISALWTLRQIGWWQMLNEVGRLAKEDSNMKVRRYALGVLKGVAELAKNQPAKGA
ncbi:MAG TPA: HEAT repeat domain-containing protein [Tepidisphaeraceae bacterium]|nr:HEAT repeat domain-containing protein [Tepidisphaeraceae bacterium]